MNDDFLSCDWGTTSFRLRWVSGPEHRVILELREPMGVRFVYEQATAGGAKSEMERAAVFAKFLHARLNELLASETVPDKPLPLVISGMASSSVGWREIPYATVPFPLDGSHVRSAALEWDKPAWVGQTILISGVATEHEMMRGEETEIIGLIADARLAAFCNCCCLILPGTHSKHVSIRNGSIIGWRTFMTGELFEVLGRHSLLRASVDLGSRPADEVLSESDRLAFREGVLWAREHGLAGGLFRVRTRAVLGRHPLAENTSFFSGLLIGAELAGFCGGANQPPLILAAPRALTEPYALALETLAFPEMQTIRIPAEQMERAAINAHALLLRQRRRNSV